MTLLNSGHLPLCFSPRRNKLPEIRKPSQLGFLGVHNNGGSTHKNVIDHKVLKTHITNLRTIVVLALTKSDVRYLSYWSA